MQIGNVLTHVDSGLTNGQPYYYNVTAVNGAGEGPSSNEATATPSSLPSAPTGLGSTAGSAQVTLTWTAPTSDGGSPITNYRIYRGPSSGGETFLIEIGATLTHVDTGLTSGVTYYYTVSARNANGEGPQSNEANATPTAGLTVPSAPRSLSALAGNSQVSLTWSAPATDGGSPITNYTIYRGLASGGETFLVQIGNVLSHTDLGLTNGVTYYYTVNATNGVGEGPPSNEANATPATTPMEPGNLQTFAGNAQITLTWQPPVSDGGLPITNYRVYRGLAPGTEAFLVEIGAVLTYLDSSLTNGQEYCYVVTALNGVGEGPPSNEACATPTSGPTAPSAPQNLTAVGGDSQVVLTWSAPASDGGSGVTNYRVHRSVTPGVEVFLIEIGNVLTYTDTSLVNGQTYYYMVSAVNGVGEGPRSNETSATPASSATPPSAARNLAATPGDGVVGLTWQAPATDGGSAVTNYRVYRGVTSGGEVFLFDAGNVLAYTDTGVTNGQTYYYVVRARNSIGEGPPSNEVSAMPSAPANQLPTCAITAPVPSETVSGVYLVRGTATDSDGIVQSVEVRIDAGAWSPANLSGVWSYALDTSTLTDGQHVIGARSYDGSNYSAEATVTITVRNASTPPPGGSIFEQWWFWVGLLIAIALALLILFFIFLWRRREKEDDTKNAPASGGPMKEPTAGSPESSSEAPPPPADEPSEEQT